MQTADGYRVHREVGRGHVRGRRAHRRAARPPRARRRARALTDRPQASPRPARYLGPEHYLGGSNHATHDRVRPRGRTGPDGLQRHASDVETKSARRRSAPRAGRPPRRRPRRSSTRRRTRPARSSTTRAHAPTCTTPRAPPTATRGRRTARSRTARRRAARYRIYVSFLQGDTTVGIAETDRRPGARRRHRRLVRDGEGATPTDCAASCASSAPTPDAPRRARPFATRSTAERRPSGAAVVASSAALARRGRPCENG